MLSSTQGVICLVRGKCLIFWRVCAAGVALAFRGIEQSTRLNGERAMATGNGGHRPGQLVNETFLGALVSLFLLPQTAFLRTGVKP